GVPRGARGRVGGGGGRPADAGAGGGGWGGGGGGAPRPGMGAPADEDIDRRGGIEVKGEGGAGGHFPADVERRIPVRDDGQRIRYRDCVEVVAAAGEVQPRRRGAAGEQCGIEADGRVVVAGAARRDDRGGGNDVLSRAIAG